VREAQYHELNARKRASLLRGFMFVHLKDDLDVDPIDWIGCLDPFDASDDARPAFRRGPLTRYGIAKDVQELLSGVRTDLDSFSDVESFALMTSGYRMTEHEFKFSNCVEGFPEPAEQHPWDFLAVEDGLKGSGPKYEYLKRRLQVSNARAFRIWKISQVLKLVSVVLAVAAAALAIWIWFNYGATSIAIPPFTVWTLGLVLGAVVAVFLVITFVLKRMGINRLTEALVHFVAFLAVGPFAAVVSLVHLLAFDRLFLRDGSLKSFDKAS
jgi:hypothetical protein